MSYYRPSFSQTAAMTRGGRGFSRGTYRGSNRGNNSWGGNSGRGGGYTPRGSHHRNNMFNSSFSGFDSRSKYGNDRYDSRHNDDFRKPYRSDNSYGSNRDFGHRSPDRKRPRNEAHSSRHESAYGGYGAGSGRYSEFTERRSFSNDRHQGQNSTPFSSRRNDDFRRPSGPPRGGYRGRIASSRGSRGLKLRERTSRKRLLESSYGVKKRLMPTRSTDYARRLKISKMRSAIAARKKPSSDKEDSDDEAAEKEVKMEADAAESATIALKPEKEREKDSDNEKEGDEKDEKDEGGPKKSFIRLNCPHCNLKAVTFRKYDIHLQGRTHMMAMRKVSLKQKSILAQMRLAQRNAQNELEKTSEDLAPRTNFCPLCKLNYKQRKAVHQSSEAHKNMKKFLMPFCKLCSLTFKSPMMYESHCCSIEHLKRKQRVENGENSDEFDEENNLENFTTIDSVGVDGEQSEEDDSGPKTENPDFKEPVSVGIEQIRKVEAYYCDLCRMYVGKGNDDMLSAILTRHCKQRTHMQRYIRYKEDKDLEKRAEKLQRKEMAEKEPKVEVKSAADKVGSEAAEKGVETGSSKEKGEKSGEVIGGKAVDDEEARDDKLWADVDKDLDDILAKEGNKSSDEDEDINGERYDRFKYSEKNGDEKVKEEPEKGAKIEQKTDVAIKAD